MSLFTDTTTLLADTANTFWTAQQVYDRLNDAMLEVWPMTRHDVYTDNLVLTSAAEGFTLPAKMMIPQRIYANGRWYDVETLWDMERRDNEWRKWVLGEPFFTIPTDAFTCMIAPSPSTTYAWKIEGVQYPQEEISAGNLDISDPKPVKEAVAFYAAALCVAATRPDLAEDWFENARNEAAEVRRRMRERRGATVSLHARDGGARLRYGQRRNTWIGSDPYA